MITPRGMFAPCRRDAVSKRAPNGSRDGVSSSQKVLARDQLLRRLSLVLVKLKEKKNSLMLMSDARRASLVTTFTMLGLGEYKMRGCAISAEIRLRRGCSQVYDPPRLACVRARVIIVRWDANVGAVNPLRWKNRVATVARWMRPGNRLSAHNTPRTRGDTRYCAS